MNKGVIDEYIALSEWYRKRVYEWCNVPKVLFGKDSDKTYEQIKNEELWVKMRRKDINDELDKIFFKPYDDGK